MTDEPTLAHVVDCETGEERLVQLSAKELRQRDAEIAVAIADNAAREQAMAGRGELVQKLLAGTATVEETQAALAEVLGATPPLESAP